MRENISTEEVQKLINELNEKKEQLENEERNAEVQIQMLTQNLQKYEEYLQQNFGTTDLESLQNILDEKKKELQEWVNQVNQKLGQ